MSLIDTHAHLDDSRFDADRRDVEDIFEHVFE